MRITKQPSGGRGEYEISEDAPNGLRPDNLFDRAMRLRLGPYQIETGIILTNQGGKRRLRQKVKRRGTHIEYQVANALLMPQPIRSEKKMEEGLPVLQNERYIISRVHLGDVHLTGSDAFVADAVAVEYQNQSHQGQQFSVSDRVAAVETIWRGWDRFPDDMPTLLKQHESMVRSGSLVPSIVTNLIRKLQSQLAEYSADLNVDFAETTDPVPAMLEVLGQIIEAPLVPPDEIEHGLVEVRRREIKRWQQLVSRRGAASVNFRRRVRAAYDSRCIICGSRFPPTEISRNPGVDSAHILPWSQVDLDETYNGLALCKLHHWAFDEGILGILFEEGEYSVVMSDGAAQALVDAGGSLEVLQSMIGKIPEDRLPVSKADRPHPGLLERRREFVG